MAYVWMLCSAFSFASVGALAHALGQKIDWEIVWLARAGIAAACSAATMLIADVRFHFWRPKRLWVRSLAGSIAMGCTFFALARLPVAIVITLVNLYPFWVALLGWLFLKQAPPKGIWLAVMAGLAGVALLQQPQIAQGNFSVFVPLVASVAMAVVMLTLHRLQDVDTQAIVFHYSLVASVIALAAILLLNRTAAPPVSLTWKTTLMLLGVGAMATVGQFFLTFAFAAGLPSKVSVVGLTEVGFAVLYDILIWGRTFGTLSFLGIALIIAPTAWLLLRDYRLPARGHT